MHNKHLLITLLLLTLSHTSNAALYVVNTADDFPDNDRMDGVCDTGLSAQVPICSLRAAIMEANASQNVEDTIVLPNNIGIYRLSRDDEDDDAFKGDLDITDDVAVINGTQAGATIDADFIDRAFHVHANARLTLEGINLINGLANTQDTYQGGAVFVDGGELVAERVTFNNNVANQGGAINSVDALISLDQAYFHHNATSDAPSLSRGSALYFADSEVSIGNTTVAHNINPSSNPQLASIVTESSAIFAFGNSTNVLIYNSTVALNYHGLSFSGGNQLNIIQTTIANNTAAGYQC